MTSTQQITIVSISFHQIEGLGRGLMVTWLFGKLPLIGFKAASRFIVQRESSVSFLKGTWGEAKNRAGEAWGALSSSVYYAVCFPCSLLCTTPVWLLMPKHGLKEYDHEMSKFYYFQNPSGNLRLTFKFLLSYQKWWMDGWVGGCFEAPTLQALACS